ncbi:MAG: 3-oxoacyl-[acyl-carrier-protein] reductase [Clostridia bacterium]|nr:3-oxoacyl-[acyl-carrier-protein] reductase [Clostridia bacterium]NLS85579.1 3-oxoacyl-[acyl-carrier-protein] reductase [Oscillospiraceae bacterium]
MKTAIVTGAGRGIGRAICLALAAKNINLIVNYKSDAASAEKTVSACEKLGVKVLAIQGDVSTKADCEKIAAAALRAFGALDILVNNAGVTRDNLLMRMTEDEWSKVLDTNLKSAYLMTQAAVRPMLRARSGRIVNITSVVGLMGNVGQANYAASKAGLIGLTKSVAREFAAKGVTVNAVAPGFIRTDMTSKLPEEAAEKLALSIPQGRFGDASDVANAVAFLTDDSSAYITGQVLAVDGGMTMR